MSSIWRIAILCVVLCLTGRAPDARAAEPTHPTAVVPPPTPLRDGLHDMDFAVGAWKEHTYRLKNPLTGSTTWSELDGYSIVRPLMSGHANLAEYEGDGPNGHLTLLSLRIYDSASQQWKMNFSTPARGALWPTPLIGRFVEGRGELYSQDDIDGRAILVRFVFTHASPTTMRSEQAYSVDGGKTWEVNWIDVLTRLSEGEAARLIAQRAAQFASTPEAAGSEAQHAFDFDFGTWKTHIARRTKPLSGSDTWTPYDGTRVVHKLWNGRANLVEITADGPAGHIEGIGLRLYNPQSHQWSLNFASRFVETMGVPMVGEFKHGRGEFIDQETFNDRQILVRNVWSDITPDGSKFDQAFSPDGGKTWESNWTTTDTRTRPAPSGW
jgi:hypothetical protein